MAAATPAVGTNSYITNEDCDTYHEDSHHGATWRDETDENVQNMALLTAYRMLERQDFKGDRTTPGQAQKWPRTGLTDEEGVAIASDAVPQFIIDAQCELALALMNNAAVQTNNDASSNIKKLEADTAKITYFRPESGPRFPTIIDELIGFYLEGSASLDGFFYPVAYGTDAESGINAHTLSEGL